MKIDIEGRVKNVNLPYSKALHPLFETIINSIHAIEERGQGNGYVNITIERDTSQSVIDEDHYDLHPIASFKVEDDGVGFNQQNYDSFQTSDTKYKQAKGGKGVGRFIWLKAFEAVHIDSIFVDDEGSKRRRFDFLLSEEEGRTKFM